MLKAKLILELDLDDRLLAVGKEMDPTDFETFMANELAEDIQKAILKNSKYVTGMANAEVETIENETETFWQLS
jgi:hypothetical protein